MTENETRPSGRDAGLDQAQETLHRPAGYPLPAQGASLRVARVGGDGLAWSDDEASAGVTWVRFTPAVAALWTHFQAAAGAGVHPGTAFQLALDDGMAEGEEYGDTDSLDAAFDDLMDPGA